MSSDSGRLKVEGAVVRRGDLLVARLSLYDDGRKGLQIYLTAESVEEMRRKIENMLKGPRWLGDRSDKAVREGLASLLDKLWTDIP